MRYLDPKNDIAFKKIFGVHKDLCISLLNALLPLAKENEIQSIEYVDSDVLPENPLKKNSVVDVRCKDALGREFLVEMQLYWSKGFKQRTLYNVTKAYSSQLVSGANFRDLKPVYALCIINDNFEESFIYRDKYLYTYTLRDSDARDLQMEDLCMVFVELPKFKPENKVQEKMKNLWLSFLKDIKEGTRSEDVDHDLFENELTKKALDTLEEMSFSRAERLSYEKMWDDISKERTVIFDAEEKIAMNLEKGRAQGRAEGRVEGRAEEKISNILGVRNLLSPQQIAEAFKLPLEEVKKILNGNY